MSPDRVQPRKFSGLDFHSRRGFRVRRRQAFTLIERVPRVTHAETWWLQRTTPVNCSLQTGSLTAEQGSARSAVTTSPEGKLCRDGGSGPAPKALRGNAESTDCRTPKTESTE